MPRNNRQRAHESAAEAGAQAAEQVGSAGADIISFTTRAAERSTEQLSALFGATPNPELTVEGYRRSMELLQQSGAATAKGCREISREYQEFSRGLFETNLSAFSRLLQSRSPQDFFATQNQLFGETIARVLNANRRFAEIAKEMADGAAESITELTDESQNPTTAA